MWCGGTGIHAASNLSIAATPEQAVLKVRQLLQTSGASHLLSPRTLLLAKRPQGLSTKYCRRRPRLRRPRSTRTIDAGARFVDGRPNAAPLRVPPCLRSRGADDEYVSVLPLPWIVEQVYAVGKKTTPTSSIQFTPIATMSTSKRSSAFGTGRRFDSQFLIACSDYAPSLSKRPITIRWISLVPS
jgi:hypothetical protein